jgi:hypothetical protein
MLEETEGTGDHSCYLPRRQHSTFLGGRMDLFRCLRRSLFVVICGALACSSSTEPGPRAQLLVTNPTCSPGPCAQFHVLGFPQNQPNTPGGAWSIDLGFVASGTTCLTIPGSATFTVTNSGTGAVTTYNWSSRQSLSLGTTAGSQIGASPSTASFIPASSTGWIVSLPGSAAPGVTGPCAQLVQ